MARSRRKIKKCFRRNMASKKDRWEYSKTETMHLAVFLSAVIILLVVIFGVQCYKKHHQMMEKQKTEFIKTQSGGGEK